MCRRQQAHVGAAYRMTDEDIRDWYVSRLEHCVKLPSDVLCVHWHVDGFTPSVPRSVIDADSRSVGDLRLHPGPNEGRKTRTGLQNYGRYALSLAVKVKLVTFNRDHPTVRPNPLRIGFGCEMLENGTNQRKSTNQKQ